MKNIIIFFVGLLLPALLSAQTESGYKSYNLEDEGYSAEVCKGIYPKESGYIALSSFFYDPSDFSNAHSILLSLDENRNIVDTLWTPYPGKSGNHALFKVNNNKFLICGSYHPTGEGRHGFYVMVDENLNVLFTKYIDPEPGVENVQISFATINEDDTIDLNIDKGAYAQFQKKSIRRIDFEGNTLFDLPLEDDYTYTTFGTHYQTSDGNFVMVTTHEGETSETHVRIFKSTYEGEILWEKNNIKSTGTALGCSFPFIHPLPNDHTLLVFCKDSLVEPVGTFFGFNPNFLVYDGEGNQVNEKFLFRPGVIYIDGTRIAENGDLLLAGSYNGIGQDETAVYSWFARMNSELEFTFEAYVFVPSTHETDLLQRNRGNDFNETPDGGYIGSGLGWEALPDGSDVQQDGFTVKFDADGCWNEDCFDPVISSDVRIEVFTPKTEVMVYPNPATEHITFATDFGSGGTLTVFSASGQQVLYEEPSGFQLTLDVRDLTSGLYFVHLTDGEGRKMRARFVKESN